MMKSKNYSFKARPSASSSMTIIFFTLLKQFEILVFTFSWDHSVGKTNVLLISKLV